MHSPTHLSIVNMKSSKSVTYRTPLLTYTYTWPTRNNTAAEMNCTHPHTHHARSCHLNADAVPAAIIAGVVILATVISVAIFLFCLKVCRNKMKQRDNLKDDMEKHAKPRGWQRILSPRTFGTSDTEVSAHQDVASMDPFVVGGPEEVIETEGKEDGKGRDSFAL